MTRRRAAALAVASLGIALLVAEVGLRLLVTRAPSGQVDLFGTPLLPYVMPLAEIEETIARQTRGEGSLFQPDPELGWTPRPGAHSPDGVVWIDEAGLRRGPDPRPPATPGALRIALFGDSFVFGDEVGFADTWAERLRELLARDGISAEVLNFGVNGYGLDQAWLRWRTAGRTAAPDLVVLGFQAENMLRDLNVFRPYYLPATNVPYSKPRCVLENETLTIRNQPTLPPEAVLAVLRDPDHPVDALVASLLALDRFFDERWQTHWWQGSTLMRVVQTATLPSLRTSLRDRLGREGRDLGLALVRAFAVDVNARGARFLALHVPTRTDLVALRDGGALWYDDVLGSLAREKWFFRSEIDPRSGRLHPSFVSEIESGFQPGGHYGPSLQHAFAASVRERVGSELRAARTGERDPLSPDR